jgi:hypothetical protein
LATDGKNNRRSKWDSRVMALARCEKQPGASLRACPTHWSATGYTLAAAAAACGVNKSTVLRAIKSGKLSGTKDEHGEWHVEPAELHRVYPPVADAAAGTDALPHAAGNSTALAIAQQRAVLAEERLTEFKAMLEDMRCDRDAWRDQAQRLALPKPAEPTPVSWWRWLRSAG